MHGGADVYKANMYLAEDRILCFEIVAKRNENWVLKYVKDAKAETDVPDALPELISQRRRWLNGSFFAAVHALLNWRKIYSSGHSFLRKVMLSFEFLYNLINLIFSWFSVGNFYLAFYFLFDVSSGSFSDTGVFGKAASPVFETTRALYAFLMVATLVTSLGNRPQGTKVIYHLTVIFFSLIMTLMLFLGTWAIIQSTKAYTDAVSKNPSLSFAMYLLSTGTFRDIVISVLSTYGLYLVSSLMAFDPWHVFTSMIQYLLLLPSYVNILMVYAFCNIHDISWGTKGDNVVVAQEGPKITTDSSGQKIMETQVPSTNVADVDMAYQNMLTHLKRNMIDKPDGKQTVDQKTKQDDYFKEFRTRVVILWVTSNAILVYIFSATNVNNAIFPNRGANSVNPYLTFLFWSVAGLSLIRFLFSTIFLIQFTRDKLIPDRSKYQRVANRV
jgi:chitin synthase